MLLKVDIEKNTNTIGNGESKPLIKVENLNGTLEKETKKISFEVKSKGISDFIE